MNRKLILEERVDVPNGGGGFDVTWSSLGTVWAELRARTGTEAVVAGADRTRQRYRVVVRGTPYGAPSRPRPDQRFREGARVYPIFAVTEFDRDGHYIICDCEVGALT